MHYVVIEASNWFHQIMLAYTSASDRNLRQKFAKNIKHNNDIHKKNESYLFQLGYGNHLNLNKLTLIHHTKHS